MASSHLRLEQAADRRLAREQKGTQSTMSAIDTKHGDAAAQQAIESVPSGRSGLHGFTWRKEKKAAPFVPKPLVRRTLRVKPVDAVTETLAPHKKPGPLPTRTTLAAAAPRHGIAVDAPGQAITPELVTRPRGAEAIVRQLRSKGITVALSADGRYVIPSALSGRMFVTERALLATTHDLIRAHLAGAPLVCQVGTHDKGTDPIAVTLLVGGAPCCATCLAGRAS